MPRMIEMEKRTASVVLILEESEAGLRRFMGHIAALILIVGLCWPAAVWAEVVLEAGKIDSSTLEVEKVPVVAPSLKAAFSDSTQVDSSCAVGRLMETSDRLPVGAESMDYRRASKRIAKKLGAGGLGSVVGAAGFATVGYKLHKAYNGGPSKYDLGFFYCGLLIGNTIGAPVGVSVIDRQDDFLITLTGALLPAGMGILTLLNENPLGAWLLFVGPTVGSTLASEIWRREPSQDGRVSVSLVPDIKGRLSAVATLCF